ncbi:DUF2797 domain-containing protein [Tepidibacillus fermentans]|uniref:Uncharacterized protein DUF2797 n=1 Tax=Tepidibacillus fermentans TaxID=1281767 RepID=A0A4R3K986_9BACI|nr:DUF2797 domain-containing protein [Tepidibacillus fermentans]TCS79413.1 uncharacterized protein DUF2797 [Tepidibacillus fermentans]
MKYSGQLLELQHEYKEPIEYYLQLGDGKIPLNPYLGHTIKIINLHEIHCIYCGRKVKKTYNNGYCYPCFIKLPQNDLCIVKPNLCHYDQGTCRDSEFGDQHCMVPHYVYLALSSDVKVGLTRKTNAFKRWVDQGAIQSIPIAELPTRKMAGELEYFLSQHLPDKTNWRKMLKEEIADKDIRKIREEILALIPEEYQSYLLDVDQIQEFIYPIEGTVKNVTAINLDKQSVYEGKLVGMKGQYLIFDSGVFNIKKYAGYQVEIEIIESTK